VTDIKYIVNGGVYVAIEKLLRKGAMAVKTWEDISACTGM
jgi:hypothetical protein